MREDYLEAREAAIAACKQLAGQFIENLKTATGPEFDVTGIPIALAEVFDQLSQHDPLSVDSFYLKEMMSRLAAKKIERCVPFIEAMDKWHKDNGHISHETRHNWQGDDYSYSIDYGVRPRSWRHALIIETQTRFFLVLMRYGSNPKLHPSTMDPDFRRYCKPEVYICQWAWSENGRKKLEEYAFCHVDQLPVWMDDSHAMNGYVAHLKDEEVPGAVYYYNRISYCLSRFSSLTVCYQEEIND